MNLRTLRTCALVTASALVLSSGVCFGQTNAAEIYQQAFQLLPPNNDAVWQVLRNTNAAPDDPAVAALKARIEPALAKLTEAASMPACNWRYGDKALIWHTGMDPSQMRQISQALKFAKAVGVLLKTEAGKDLDHVTTQALDVMLLGRRVGDGGPLISYLVQVAMEDVITRGLAANLPDMPPDQAEAVAARFEGLPIGGTLASAVGNEKAVTIDWLIQSIRHAQLSAESGAQPAGNSQTADTGTASGTGLAGGTDHPDRTLADSLRMCSLIEVEGQPIRIGLEDIVSSNSFFLSLGDRKNEVELVSADYQREEAVIMRGTEAALIKLRARKILPLELLITEVSLRAAVGRQGRDARVPLASGGTAPVDSLVAADLVALIRPELASNIVAYTRGSSRGIVQMVLETSGDFEALSEALRTKSLPELKAWETNVVPRLNPLSQALVPALYDAAQGDAAVRVRRDLFRAAAAVVREGPQALSRFPDPYGTGPFKYHPAENGFELASELVITRGSPPSTIPVTLRVGKP
ncbi:MAG: hypothetical protein V1873_03630 [Verrucomicrobiota bacterium]